MLRSISTLSLTATVLLAGSTLFAGDTKVDNQLTAAEKSAGWKLN